MKKSSIQILETFYGNCIATQVYPKISDKNLKLKNSFFTKQNILGKPFHGMALKHLRGARVFKPKVLREIISAHDAMGDVWISKSLSHTARDLWMPGKDSENNLAKFTKKFPSKKSKRVKNLRKSKFFVSG